jgi:hypothetical protein
LRTQYTGTPTAGEHTTYLQTRHITPNHGSVKPPRCTNDVGCILTQSIQTQLTDMQDYTRYHGHGTALPHPSRPTREPPHRCNPPSPARALQAAPPRTATQPPTHARVPRTAPPSPSLTPAPGPRVTDSTARRKIVCGSMRFARREASTGDS